MNHEGLPKGLSHDCKRCQIFLPARHDTSSRHTCTYSIEAISNHKAHDSSHPTAIAKEIQQ